MFVSLEEIAEEQRDLEARMAAWLKKVAAYDRSGDWAADGFLNTASALRAVCRIDQGVARGHVELARKLGDLPQVAAAFERGEISARHAVVVANAYTPERAGAISDVETELVNVARQHLPKQLGGVVRYLIDAIDGDGGAVSDDALFERRRLHLSSTLDGMLRHQRDLRPRVRGDPAGRGQRGDGTRPSRPRRPPAGATAHGRVHQPRSPFPRPRRAR